MQHASNLHIISNLHICLAIQTLYLKLPILCTDVPVSLTHIHKMTKTKRLTCFLRMEPGLDLQIPIPFWCVLTAPSQRTCVARRTAQIRSELEHHWDIDGVEIEVTAEVLCLMSTSEGRITVNDEVIQELHASEF